MNGNGEHRTPVVPYMTPRRRRSPLLALRTLFLPLATSLILLIPTLLYRTHGRAVFAEFQQSRVAQYEFRLAKRIQTEIDSQLRPLRRLSGEIASGDVSSAQAFANSARSICREEPTLKYIAWIATDGTCISASPADAATKIPIELFGAGNATADRLFARLANAPNGVLLSFPTGSPSRASDRLILLPILKPRQPSAPSTISGALVTCETTQAMLGAMIPPDASAPFIVEVKDERGQILFASDGATSPAAEALLRSADVDQISLMDQSWSMAVAAAPPGLGQRPAGDTDAFLLSGVIVALLGGATVAQADRHRRRERQKTAAHLAALEALHAVAASISCKPRAEDEVLQRLLDAACQLLRMPMAFVCEVDGDKPAKLSREVGFAHSADASCQALMASQLIQRCLRMGEILTIEDLLDLSPDAAALQPLGIRSLFVFPLSAGEDRIGLMALCDGKPRRFSDEDFRLARLWASQAAVTLANQRLAAANDEALVQQRRLNQQVRRDADAKAMLLRELNHRVKNNLAGIVGLLSAGVPELSEHAQQWLDRAIARIETLARAHELFVGTSSALALSDLVSKTMEPIYAIKPAGVQIVLDVSAVHEPLSTDQAVTLAMVIHELASNALQHGLGDHGKLTVRAAPTKAGWATVEVIDDGSRTPERDNKTPIAESSADGGVATLPAQAARTGIGLQLVRGLVGRELHGIFSMKSSVNGGMVTTIEFPIGDKTTNSKIGE